MLTIFTPIYNRANLIEKLYNSLCLQSCKDFEWIVVDDGSSDDINSVMERFIDEDRLRIRFYKQPNGGKHRAINTGVNAAEGEFFFIVDSDDYITEDAVEWIKEKTDLIKDKPEFAGISGIRIQPDGSRPMNGKEFPDMISDAIEIRETHKVKGDLAEIYKTSILKRYPFPDIPGEKFCAEGVVWNRIAEAGYKIKYYYRPIYHGEYLPGGLTASSVTNRRNNPEYTMLRYSEQLKSKKYSLTGKIKSALLYWKFSEKSDKDFMEKARAIPGRYWIFSLPGMLMSKFKI